MKIAQVTPLYEAVPPRLYGGTERVVAHLTDALVDLGHDVTLFASADAETRARLIPVRDQAIRLDPAPFKSDLAAHMVMLSEVLKRADDFDVIHFHTDMIQFPMFERYADRTLTTLHGRLDMKDIGGVYERWPQFGLVSISDDQRRPLPFANWKATVHHGMPGELYRFSPKPEGYLAFLGRISPEKRPDRAIEIATRLNKPLKMAAKIDAADKVYWETVIRPLVEGNPLVEFVGEIGDHQKSAFLGGAEALLFPIDWPEPFGLVMIEAMACGTPVVAFRCGSTPEVIEDGETGYLVDTLEQAVAAAGRAHLLDREAVRARFDLRFSATAMARRYLDVYGDLSAQRPFAEQLIDGYAAPRHEPLSFAVLA
ncbi:glycosyltransferase family 4 protein [Brevundimonas mediterranea]|uniref:Glycosyltransferase involved in cell wall biosynthesis n=1 Tax=Brevundimonas mediterranea TaxID=74329 RepID=A0A7W6A7C7_9CAUL|nr:glycosyltransferase family 4 protein [Brevundimonas mediterranea]MBB3873052.1 glycosyltransferase involved in cell wall biosynthesis [Brevundimonas mediterranea]